MPFGRLHEEAAGDGKLLALSDAAWRMWGSGLIYCQRNLTDGFIPTHAIDAFGVKERNKTKVADELCRPQVPGKAPVWTRVDGGFQIHDYLDWNDSKDEILKGRAAGRDRISRFRQRQQEELDRLKSIAERAGEPTDERNALRDSERHALNVVRGSGEESKENQDRRRHGPTGSGAMAGALPRDHRHHVACDPTYARCVPQAVHDKLADSLAPKYGGDQHAAKDALQAWYPTVWKTLARSSPCRDAFKFWQGAVRRDVRHKRRRRQGSGRRRRARTKPPTT
jgi:hypothetical protein